MSFGSVALKRGDNYHRLSYVNLLSNEAGNNISSMDINCAYSHDLLSVS